MKRLFKVFTLLFATVLIASCGRREVKSTPEVNITTVVSPADGLDLKLVGGLLQDGKVTNAEGLEKELNRDGSINNLDLNSDGSVDYINVSENKSELGTVKSFDLTTGKDAELTHIATVEVEKKGDEYHINMSGNETVYGSGHNYHSSFHSTGQLLFYAWLFSPRPYYYHPPYYRGYYPSYYGGSRVVVSRTTYRSRTTTQRATASKSITKTKTPNTRVKSKNSGKTSTKARSSVNAHNKQVKQMKARNTNKAVKKGGFTKNKPPSTSRSSSTKKSTSNDRYKRPTRSSSRSSSSSRSRRSDVTYKKDIKEYQNGLDIVLDLNSVYYYWDENIDYSEVVGGCYDLDTTRQVGFIAQEVEVLVPEVVNNDEYGKTVDYDLLVPILVNAIQEQQKQIDSLRVIVNNK